MSDLSLTWFVSGLCMNGRAARVVHQIALMLMGFLTLQVGASENSGP